MPETLEDVVQAQKSQLEKYENKLKDVVQAYKSLQAEKKALEIALSALGNEGEGATHSSGADSPSEVEGLKTAITTLTVENKKKELAFQADKRNMLAQKEKLEQLVESLRAGANKTKDFITDLYKQIHTKDQQLQANASIVSRFEQVQDEMLRWKKQAEHTPRESVLIHELEQVKKSQRAELELERGKREANKEVDQNKDERIHVLENRVSELTLQLADSEQQRVQLAEQCERSQPTAPPRAEASNAGQSNHLRLTFVKTYQKLKCEEDFDVYELLGLPTAAPSVGPHVPSNETAPQALSCTKCGDSHKELAYFKTVICHLQGQLKALEESQELTRLSHDKVAKSLRTRIAELEETQERTHSELTAETKRKVAELEEEIQKQRHRMAAMMDEKNREIESVKRTIGGLLRDNADPMDPQPVVPSGHRNSVDSLKSAFNNSFDDESAPSVSRPKRSENWRPNDAKNIFYEQQLSRLEHEIADLKNVLRMSELKIGDMEQASLTKDMQYLEIIETLKEEVRVSEGKLKLQPCDTNMEYLRNVFVQFLNSTSATDRKCVLRAIALVLKLTRAEMKGVDNWVL